MKLSWLPNCVTIGNAVCGTCAIFFAARGELMLAAHLVIAGMLLDTLDGPLARRFGATHTGELLDRFSDRLTQAVAPATILVVASGGNLLAMFSGTALVIAGIARLVKVRAEQRTAGLIMNPAALVITTGIFLSVAPAILSTIALLFAFFEVSAIPYPIQKNMGKPVATIKDWRQPLFMLARAAPLAILAIPSPVHSLASAITFAVVLAAVAIGTLAGLSKLRSTAKRNKNE